MDADSQRQRTATVAAEEILRIIYGDDLEGCTVSLDRITEVISTAMAGQAECDRAVAELEALFGALPLMLGTGIGHDVEGFGEQPRGAVDNRA